MEKIVVVVVCLIFAAGCSAAAVRAQTSESWRQTESIGGYTADVPTRGGYLAEGKRELTLLLNPDISESYQEEGGVKVTVRRIELTPLFLYCVAKEFQIGSLFSFDYAKIKVEREWGAISDTTEEFVLAPAFVCNMPVNSSPVIPYIIAYGGYVKLEHRPSNNIEEAAMLGLGVGLRLCVSDSAALWTQFGWRLTNWDKDFGGTENKFGLGMGIAFSW